MGQRVPGTHQLGVHLRTVRRVITTQELADYLGITPRTLRTWMASGKLVFTGNLEEDMLLLQSLKRGRTS